MGSPATFKFFSSSFLEIGQKHIPYTMGPGSNNKNALSTQCYDFLKQKLYEYNQIAVINSIPRTGPLPASSMPKQHSSVRQISGIWEVSRQLTELSVSNRPRSMKGVCSRKRHKLHTLVNDVQVLSNLNKHRVISHWRLYIKRFTRNVDNLPHLLHT